MLFRTWPLWHGRREGPIEGQLPACVRLIDGRLSGCRLAAIVNVWNSAAPASGIAHISPPTEVGTGAVQISRPHPIAAGDASHKRRLGAGSITSLCKARSRARVRSSSAPASRLNPATSATRIAASLRASLITPFWGRHVSLNAQPSLPVRRKDRKGSIGPIFSQRSRNDRYLREALAGAGRVGVWRGGVRLSISVCRPFRLAVP